MISNKRRFMISQFILCIATSGFMPVFYVFLSRKEYGDIAIGWYYAIFWLVSTLCEVPFGVFTDKFGTKKTLIVSVLLKIVGFVLLLIPRIRFINLIVIGVLTGMGEAGLSGCLPSWFVNKNNEAVEKDDIAKVFAQTGIYCCILSLVVGFVAGQILFIKNINYPIFFSLMIFIIALLFFAFFPKERVVEKEIEKTQKCNFRDMLLSNTALIIVFVGFSVSDIINCAPGNQWSKVFEDLNWYGYIWIGFNVATMLGNALISHLQNTSLTKRKNDLLIAIEIMLLAIAFLVRTHLVVALVLFLCYVFFYQIHTTLYGAYIHSSIIVDDAKRNQNISLFNMTNSLLCTLTLVVVGYLCSMWNMMLVWLVVAVGSGLMYLCMRNKMWGNNKKDVQD